MVALAFLIPPAGFAQPLTDPRDIEIRQAQDTLRLLYSRNQFEEVVLQSEALLELDDGNATAYLMKLQAERQIALRDAPPTGGTARIPRPPLVPTSMARESEPRPLPTPYVPDVGPADPVEPAAPAEPSEPAAEEPPAPPVAEDVPAEPADPGVAAPPGDPAADPATDFQEMEDMMMPPAATTQRPAGTSFLAMIQNNMLYIVAALLLLIIVLAVFVVLARRRREQTTTASDALTGAPRSMEREGSLGGAVAGAAMAGRDQPTGEADSPSGIHDAQTGLHDAQTGIHDEDTYMADAQTGVADQPTGQPDQPSGVSDAPTAIRDEPTGAPDRQTGAADEPTIHDPQTSPEAAGESPTVELDKEEEEERVFDSQAGDYEETTGGAAFEETGPGSPPSSEVDVDFFATPPPSTPEKGREGDEDQTYNSLMFGAEEEETGGAPDIAAGVPETAGASGDDDDETYHSLMFGATPGETEGGGGKAEDESDVSLTAFAPGDPTPPGMKQPEEEETSISLDNMDTSADAEEQSATGESTKPLPGMEKTATPPPAEPPEEKTVASPAPKEGGGRGNLFDRQREAGKAAMEQEDYAKAVQCLSVAASLKPGDKEVRSLLDEARKKRRGG